MALSHARRLFGAVHRDKRACSLILRDNLWHVGLRSEESGFDMLPETGTCLTQGNANRHADVLLDELQ